MEQPGGLDRQCAGGCQGAVPNNTRGSMNITANEAARYYDVTLSNPGTITLDMNPTDRHSVDRRGRSRSSSSVGPTRLQVLLDTTLSAGTLTMLPGGMLATGTYTQTGGLLQFQLGAQRQRQDRGCQHCHPGRHLGRRRDTGTLWSVDLVYARDRGHDQRPVRAIHLLPAFRISFALWALSTVLRPSM